jgi:hypothetical protein
MARNRKIRSGVLAASGRNADEIHRDGERPHAWIAVMDGVAKSCGGASGLHLTTLGMVGWR